MKKDNELIALENLIISPRKDLQKFIYTLTSDHNAVEDIFQNTIATAFINLKKLRNPEVIRSWVFNIAKTETSHYYRDNNIIGFRRGIDVLMDGIEALESDVLDMVTEKEFCHELQMLVNELEYKYNRVICLYYYHGLELKEIAQMDKINYNTVRTNHKRAIQKLKELYEVRMER